jgi:hypothetical protein
VSEQSKASGEDGGGVKVPAGVVNPYPSKVKRVCGIRMECEAPSHLRQYVGKPYGSPEYYEAVSRAYEEWARELREFMRDHRSRDEISLTVVRDTEEVCAHCKLAWEIDNDGVPCCCEKAMDAFFAAKPDVAAKWKAENGVPS